MNERDMPDDELLHQTAIARRAAHEAPLNPFRLDANGRRWVEQQSGAWADRSREWARLADEIDRRGLKQPDLLPPSPLEVSVEEAMRAIRKATPKDHTT